VPTNQTKANWTQATATDPSFIQNKPIIVSAFTNDANYLTSATQNKADWTQATTTAASYIQNKPTIVSAFTNDAAYITGAQVPTNQTKADWAQVTTTAASFIQNKPTAVSYFTNDAAYLTTATQNKADWNQATSTAASYIQNKPTAVSVFTNDALYLKTATLPVSSTTVSGIVQLSASLVSASATTAATSSAVALLYPATQAIDVSVANAATLKKGSAYVTVNSDNTNVGINCIPAAGVALDVTGSVRASGDITAFSDARVKTNLVRIPNALEKVLQLNGYTFTRTDVDDTKRYMGVIAQDVAKIIPEVVQGDDATGFSVAYGNITALLIEAIKELAASRA
jgi:hypothetical protein